MTTRIARDELLEHPMRSRILDAVRGRPGIGLRQLRDQVQPDQGGCAFSSLYHHLRLLEEFGIVTTRRAGRYRRVYLNGGPQGSSATALSILQNEPLPALAHLLMTNPGANQSAIWKHFRERHPCSRQIIGYHLRRLEAHALTRSSRQGAAKTYYPTDTLERLFPLAAHGGETSHAAVLR